MGTNYYWRKSECSHCGRYQEVHVGKNSVGWSFGFRGYRHRLLSEDHPDWGYAVESPLGKQIASRKDWQKIFEQEDGSLWNEHGIHIEDPVSWITGMEPPTPEQIHWENRHRGLSTYRWSDRDECRDSEGFHVGFYEFS